MSSTVSLKLIRRDSSSPILNKTLSIPLLFRSFLRVKRSHGPFFNICNWKSEITIPSPLWSLKLWFWFKMVFSTSSARLTATGKTEEGQWSVVSFHSQFLPFSPNFCQFLTPLGLESGEELEVFTWPALSEVDFLLSGSSGSLKPMFSLALMCSSGHSCPIPCLSRSFDMQVSWCWSCSLFFQSLLFSLLSPL